VKKPIAVSAVNLPKKNSDTAEIADTAKPSHPATDLAGELIDQERANQLHYELKKQSQHTDG